VYSIKTRPNNFHL